MAPLLELKDVACVREKGKPIFTHVNVTINNGDVVVLTGKSGSGKTTLLKCIAHLNVYDGEVLFHGRSPKHYGVPTYRTRVLYVPQRPSLLPGTPRDLLGTIASFGARAAPGARSTLGALFGARTASAPSGSGAGADTAGAARTADADRERPFALARGWGLEDALWDRTWGNLSGGEAQRILLAIAVGLGAAEVLLLDEPTSALDAEASHLVEKHIVDEVRGDASALKAVVWITHSAEQSQRVGTRFLEIEAGGIKELHEARAPEV